MQCLDGLPGDERTQVGFVTYDSAVHFYSLKAGLHAPQMLVVPDVDELFMPVPEVRGEQRSWFVPLPASSSLHTIVAALSRLPAPSPPGAARQSERGASPRGAAAGRAARHVCRHAHHGVVPGARAGRRL